MKITEETKIKDIIPKGWELDTNVEYDPILHYCHNSLSISVRQKKSKTIEDYEKELNNSSDRIISKSFFSILKDDYPKQYYSIILQMIADDICEEGEKRCGLLFEHPDNDCIESIPLRANYLGTIKFDTEEHSNQAIEIMGDKLKLLI